MHTRKNAEKAAKPSTSGRSVSKRWLLSSDEPRLYECGQIEELSEVFGDQAEACRYMEVPISLVLIEVANFDEIESLDSQTPAEIVKEVAENLLPVVRAQDLVVHYAEKYIAILLVDANQDLGAKVCQRFKEAVHKYSYFHAGASTVKLDFGLSDDSTSHYEELEGLILSADKALKIAHDRGDGAIVRSSDCDPNKEFRDREHFFPGDRLSSFSD